MNVKRLHLRWLGMVLVAAASLAVQVHAANVTTCTAIKMCYCVNADFKSAVDDKVAYFRAAIAEQRAKGRAVGYLSIPLSTVGGGYFNLNREVAEKAKQRIEARLGAASAWVINPAAKEADLPTLNGVRASQGDYLLMWTRILEGVSGLGEDLDFVYFAGPSDFAAFFGLTGAGDMDRLAAYFEDRMKTDADLKRAVERGSVSAVSFRNYYGLRASAAFSVGAHDEWNVIRTVNARRRDDPKYGVANQLPIMFDGRAITSGEFEQAVGGGNAGECKG